MILFLFMMLIASAALLWDPLSVKIPDDIPGSEEDEEP